MNRPTSILDSDGQPYERKGTVHDLDRLFGERNYEAADTNRLNDAHWINASDQHINVILASQLSNLRKRSLYETRNNGFVRGMINTHKVDLIGADGPKLTAVSEEEDETTKRYVANLNSVVRDWMETPEISGCMALADVLRQDVEMLWAAGEAIWLTVDDEPTPDNPVSLRIQTVNPRDLRDTGSISRLGSANQRQSGKILGVHVDARGRILGYDIEGFADAVPARNIEHLFRADEPGQRRGVPWMSSILQDIADLRDYDVQVLDAARAAADYAVMLMPNSDQVEPIDIKPGTSVPIRRRQITTGPPGYTVTALQPTQPQASYLDHRKERHADFGRPVSMPGLISRADASNHNFSSSRFDARKYDAANAEVRAWIARCRLNRVIRRVESEAGKRGILMPNGRRVAQRPGPIRFHWTWTTDTHVAADPNKEAKAAAARMDSRISTMADEVARFSGRSLPDHLKILEREAEMFRDSGLPTQAASPAGEAGRQLFSGALMELARDPESFVTDRIREYQEGEAQEDRHNAALR